MSYNAINSAPEAQAFLNRVKGASYGGLNDVLAASIKDETELRRLFATDRKHARLANPYVGLVSVFDVQSSIGLNTTRARVVKDEADRSAKFVFPLSDDKRRKDGTPAMADSFADFQKNWTIFSEGSLSQLTDWNNVVVAGGSVLGCLLHMDDAHKESKRAIRKYFHSKAFPTSDVDMFLWGLNAEQAEAKITQIYEAVRDSVPWEVTCVRTKHAVSIHSQYPYRSIQIVLRLYHSPAEILAGFDVDAPCVAYDGTRVLANPRALVSIIRQANTVDMSRRSPSYEVRLAKYASRGFEVYVPDLRREDVDPTIFERSINRITGLARMLVLERLSKPESRVSYLESRRALRSRPNNVSASYHRQSAKSQRQYKGDLKGDEEFGGLEMNDYDVSTLHIPYGPGWTARRIEKLVYQTDLGMNSTFNPRNKDRRLHRHAAFFGTIDECTGDQCGHCPTPKNDGERTQQEEDDKNYVRGRISFLAEDPGRQTMTGSFNPIDIGEWSEFAYLGSTEKLFAAISEGADATVSSKIPSDVVDLNRRDHVGRTPLHMAIMCKAVDISIALIDAGVRMTARLVDGRTALHLAAQQNLPTVIAKLLEKSSENDSKAKAEEEAKAVAAAAQKAAKAEEEMDIEKDEEEENSSDDDWESVGEGDKNAVTAGAPKEAELPPAGADIPDDDTELPDVFDINVFDWDFSFSPLAHAIVSGSKEAVKQLLDAGADAKLASKISSDYDANVMHPLALTVLTIDSAKAEAIVEYLLRAGASSAQADEKLFSIFHAAVCSGKTHIVQKLLQEDPHAKAALNVPVATYNQKLYPIVSAIANGHHAIVASLLGYGSKVAFTAEDLEKANNLMYYTYYQQNNTTPHVLDYLQQLALPAETSISALNYLLHLIVPLGAQVSVPINEAFNTSRYNKEACLSLLDFLEKEIKLLNKQLEEAAKDKPKEAKRLEFSQTPKTFLEHRRFIKGKLLEFQASKKESSPDSDDSAEKMKSVRVTIAYYEDALKVLRAHNAKTWYEIYPEQKPKDEENKPRQISRQDTIVPPEDTSETRQQYRLMTRSYQFNPVLPHQLDLYDALFEAAWTGDNERIQELCLPLKPKSDVQPIQISVTTSPYADSNTGRGYSTYGTDGSFTPLAAAILNRKWDTARLIMTIAAAQLHKEENKPAEYSTRHINLNDDESESEPEDDDGEDDEMDLDEGGKKELNFVNLAEHPSAVRCSVTPYALLSQLVSGRLNRDGTKEIDTGSLLNQTCQEGDLEAFVNMCELLKSYPDEDADSTEPPTSVLNSILSCDSPAVLDELIRRTGVGIGMEDIRIPTQTYEDDADGKYYLGLTVKGKKRKDLASEGHKQALSNQQVTQIPLLWQALRVGAVKIVEYLLGPGPLAAFRFYASTSTSKYAERLRTVPDLDKRMPALLGLTPNLRKETALSAILLGTSKENSLKMAKLLFALQPNRVKEYMQSRIMCHDLPPILLAVYTRCEPSLFDYLLANGASADVVDRRGCNLYHIICQLGYSELLTYFLEKLPEDLSSRLMTQTVTESGNTPLMLAVKANSIPIVEKLVKSGIEGVKVSLSIRDSKGSMPLHETVSNGRPKLTSFLVSLGGTDILYAENGVGETPLDTATARWLLTGTRAGYPGKAPRVSTLSTSSSGNGSLIVSQTSEDFQEQVRKMEDAKAYLEKNGKFVANAKFKDALDSYIVFLARKAGQPSVTPKQTTPPTFDSMDRTETLKIISSSVFASPGERQLVQLSDVQLSVQSSLKSAADAYKSSWKYISQMQKDAEDNLPEEKTEAQKAEELQWSGILSWSSIRYTQL
ncbi:ankyrin [Schizopora paradoxa]|uniref:Ankyrin n=1 Tax=Schizopora paradoxa TaxID=27342 RepID=A0A0H2RI60_9AGAM|nr:ankyrin [Schizopora paradoxa]